MTDTKMGGSLALVGANLITNTDAHRGATAILVTDGVIAKIGSDREIRSLAEASSIEVRDVDGATVTPGLFDSHSHPHWAVELTAGIDLGGITTIEKLREALAAEHSRLPDGAWLIGWNLEFEVFQGTQVHADLIEEAVEGRPTAIMFYDLHTGFANRAALEAAGITGPIDFADTSEVVIGEDGRPTGELREPSAYKLAFAAAPPRPHDEEREALAQMFRSFAEVGLTGAAIMDGNERTASFIEELEERGELAQRLTVHHWHAVADDDSTIAYRIAQKNRGGRLWDNGAIKLFSDGVIDTGTAWLHRVDACGDGDKAFWPNWDRFAEVVRTYHDAGMLIATHAVGDYAVNQVLAVYETLNDRPGLPSHSIEHLEILADEDIERMSGSGITASMQPLHMQWRDPENDDSWASRLGPDRWHTGYRVRDVLDAGIRLVLGSDWPVAQRDPRVGMAWARGRHTPGVSDATVFEPEQRLTATEALLAYTLWPAEARGHKDRGRIAEGMVGDLTVWAGDPVEASPDELISLPIAATVVDGRLVYEGEQNA